MQILPLNIFYCVPWIHKLSENDFQLKFFYTDHFICIRCKWFRENKMWLLPFHRQGDLKRIWPSYLREVVLREVCTHCFTSYGFIFTLNKVFSDGKIESHDGSGESGSNCFNGSQESETQGDGRDGQCKTVYVVDWLTNTRDQVWLIQTQTAWIRQTRRDCS